MFNWLTNLLTAATEKSVAAVNSAITPFEQPKLVEIKVVESGARHVPDDIVKQIEKFERMYRVDGKLVYPYHDMVGFPTIGIGHLLSRVKFEDLLKYLPITIDEAYTLHNSDLDKFANGISRLVTVPINDREFGALVSLAFNIGLGNFKASTLLRKLNRGDSKEEVAAEFLKWNKAQGQIVRGLSIRRALEAKIFLGQL